MLGVDDSEPLEAAGLDVLDAVALVQHHVVVMEPSRMHTCVCVCVRNKRAGEKKKVKGERNNLLIVIYCSYFRLPSDSSYQVHRSIQVCFGQKGNECLIAVSERALDECRRCVPTFIQPPPRTLGGSATEG